MRKPKVIVTRRWPEAVEQELQAHFDVELNNDDQPMNRAALVDALKSKKIAGAGLDVFEREPKVIPELLSMENVVLLPHLGSATMETREAMGRRVLDNALTFFADREPGDRVA